MKIFLEEDKCGSRMYRTFFPDAVTLQFKQGHSAFCPTREPKRREATNKMRKM